MPADPSLPAPLADALTGIAATPRLLVASDFDGVLAPIVAEPSAARALPAALTALGALARLPRTAAAAISGRALADLARVAQLPAGVGLVGSHGAEFDGTGDQWLTPEQRELRGRLADALQSITTGAPGVHLEGKPAGITVHVRQADEAVSARVLAAVRSGPAGWAGVAATEGKEVIELAVVAMDKGAALDALREQAKATAVVFLGDDVTDEKAFATLRDVDIGVKVGPGQTLAAYRVDAPADVADLLTGLATARATHTAGTAEAPTA